MLTVHVLHSSSAKIITVLMSIENRITSSTLYMYVLPFTVRGLSTKTTGTKKSVLPYLLGSLTVGAGGYGLYKYNISVRDVFETVQKQAARMMPTVSAAEPPASQPSVTEFENLMRKPTMWFPNRSDTNRTIQL